MATAWIPPAKEARVQAPSGSCGGSVKCVQIESRTKTAEQLTGRPVCCITNSPGACDPRGTDINLAAHTNLSCAKRGGLAWGAVSRAGLKSGPLGRNETCSALRSRPGIKSHRVK